MLLLLLRELAVPYHLADKEPSEGAIQHNGDGVVDDTLTVHKGVQFRLDVEVAKGCQRADGVHSRDEGAKCQRLLQKTKRDTTRHTW